jgi:hypothetical protein
MKLPRIFHKKNKNLNLNFHKKSRIFLQKIKLPQIFHKKNKNLNQIFYKRSRIFLNASNVKNNKIYNIMIP